MIECNIFNKHFQNINYQTKYLSSLFSGLISLINLIFILLGWNEKLCTGMGHGNEAELLSNRWNINYITA